MEIAQDALDRQMRDLDLGDDISLTTPDRLTTEGEDLFSSAGPGLEIPRERRQIQDRAASCDNPVVLDTDGRDNATVFKPQGCYSYSTDRTDDSFSIFPSDSNPGEGENINLILVHSRITCRGSLAFFQNLPCNVPIRLHLYNSTLIAGTAQSGKNLQLIMYSNCGNADPDSNITLIIESNSRLEAKSGNVNLVNSFMGSHLHIAIKNSELHAQKGSVILVPRLVPSITDAAGNFTLSMSHSLLNASGTPHNGQDLLVAAVGPVEANSTRVWITNSHNNRLEAQLTPEGHAARAVAVASMGGISMQCSGSAWNTHRLEQSQLSNNSLRAVVVNVTSSNDFSNYAEKQSHGLCQSWQAYICALTNARTKKFTSGV